MASGGWAETVTDHYVYSESAWSHRPSFQPRRRTMAGPSSTSMLALSTIFTFDDPKGLLPLDDPAFAVRLFSLARTFENGLRHNPFVRIPAFWPVFKGDALAARPSSSELILFEASFTSFLRLPKLIRPARLGSDWAQTSGPADGGKGDGQAVVLNINHRFLRAVATCDENDPSRRALACRLRLLFFRTLLHECGRIYGFFVRSTSSPPRLLLPGHADKDGGPEPGYVAEFGVFRGVMRSISMGSESPKEKPTRLELVVAGTPRCLCKHYSAPLHRHGGWPDPACCQRKLSSTVPCSIGFRTAPLPPTPTSATFLPPRKRPSNDARSAISVAMKIADPRTKKSTTLLAEVSTEKRPDRWRTTSLGSARSANKFQCGIRVPADDDSETDDD